MICPLKYNKRLSNFGKMSVVAEQSAYQCIGKECAWWYKGKELECCSIKLMARALVEILRGTK